MPLTAMPLTGSRTRFAGKVHGKRRIPVLIATIALSDVLVFDAAPGLNLFLLSVSLTSMVLGAARKPLRPLPATGSLCLSALAAAPLIEAPTVSGVFLALLAVICVALAGAGLLPKTPSAAARIILRFLPFIPMRLPLDCRRSITARSGRTMFGTTVGALAGWALPLGLGLVFLLLFSAANPLIEIGLRSISFAYLLELFDIRRFGLWLVAAGFIWAMMRPRLIGRRRLRLKTRPEASARLALVLDHAMLVRSLCVFNLLFALQTLLDLTYLWGGADLPAGMSHAQYAHRGAYPLVATALLAAVFVLVAMRRGGPGDKSPLIRALVIAWILQNVLLCLSAILRLDLYVEAYSLTGLRIAAGIWMGLVAAGLIFILLRIALRRSNDWLISMNLVTLLTVLYLTAVVDISGFIARFNVENSQELGQAGAPLDISYLNALGPSALPALDLYLASVRNYTVKWGMAKNARHWLAKGAAFRSTNWRSWSYRSYRLETYLQSTALIEMENGAITNGSTFFRSHHDAPYPRR